MDNLTISNQFSETAHGTTVEQIFWLAICGESSGLHELLEELQEEDWEELIPGLTSKEWFSDVVDGDGQERLYTLAENDKLGFLAKIYVPEHSNFRFEGDVPIGSQYSGAISRIGFCYAETPDELIEKITAKADGFYQEMVQDALKKEVSTQ